MVKIQPEAIFFHVHVLSYLPIATIFASFVEGVVAVKIVNFEEYPSIATRGIARRFITVQMNCTLYVADYNYNYSVYSECTFNGEEYSGQILQRHPRFSSLVTKLLK